VLKLKIKVTFFLSFKHGGPSLSITKHLRVKALKPLMNNERCIQTQGKLNKAQNATMEQTKHLGLPLSLGNFYLKVFQF
jgi:hypothetical protein